MKNQTCRTCSKWNDGTGECCLALKLITEGIEVLDSVQAAIDLSSSDDENDCEEYTES